MASNLLLFLSAFLLLVTASAVHDKHKAPPPAPLPNHHNAVPIPVDHHAPPPKPLTPTPKPLTPPFSPPIKPQECVRQCEEKCKSHRKKRVCVRTCSTCCVDCKCIPGTYGNQENCKKCFDETVAHEMKCSAMIPAP
ncbi:hypothetical protein Ancab_001519 [Ancistrocladus abbreviatus]